MYRTTDAWKTVSAVIDKYFKQKAGLYHYLSTAKKNYREYLEGDIVKIKKYFYVLRPLLACKWILEYGEAPPMLFSTLKERYLAGGILAEVEKLLDIKINAPEKKTGERIEPLNAYLSETMAELDAAIAALPADSPRGYEELNALFLSIVR